MADFPAAQRWRMRALLALVVALNLASLAIHSSALALCGRLGGLSAGALLATCIGLSTCAPRGRDS